MSLDNLRMTGCKTTNQQESVLKAITNRKICNPIKKYEILIDKANSNLRFSKKKNENILQLNFEVSYYKDLISEIFKNRLMLIKKTQRISIKAQLVGQREVSRTCKILRKATLIQSFYLWFSFGLTITDTDFYNLSKNLERFKFLQNIDLSFDGCFQMKDFGLRKITESLGRLNSLKKLNLYFSYCTKVQLRGLPRFNKGLQNLSLSFSQCFNVTDAGLQDLSQSLRGLSCLQNITLIFSYNLRFTDLGLCSIGEALEKLVSLQNIYLKFLGCSSLTENGLQILWRSLEKISSFQTISLNLGECFYLTIVAQEKIRKLFKNDYFSVDVRFSFCSLFVSGKNSNNV